MDGREASPQEANYLKKKYLRQTLVMGLFCLISAGMAVWMCVRVVQAVRTEAGWGYICYYAVMLLVYLTFLGYMGIFHVRGEFRRYRCVKRGRIRIIENAAERNAADRTPDGEVMIRTRLLVDFPYDKDLGLEWIEPRS
ncbi:MAG: hypothetical protein IKS10_00135 [Lachnospiraceae bacterium]|nr:hypothetical protein [Lachnospiraceae bacterium]